MDKMTVGEHYFFELGRCKHYDLKCQRYQQNDPEKYDKYRQKFLHHRKMAAKYYFMMRESPVYTDFLDDESIYSDSRYFNESTSSTASND